jgi:glycosyltransferase involved in cell wall biosynthesis
MKIGFYSPYFDSLSGGERYVLTLASHWSKIHNVSLFWDDASVIQKAQHRLNIDLSKVGVVENVFKTKNLFKKLKVSRGYDLIFFLTDGSVPTTFAKYNILHFQVPFSYVPVHAIKLRRFGAIVCNSKFTKHHIDSRVGKHSIVIYPPVEAIATVRAKKENIIISVGRFSSVKKQDVLIDAFRKGASMLKECTLVFAGGLLPSDAAYFEKLKRDAKGLSIQFYPNCSFDTLTDLYNKARIYWHAAGYQQNAPESMEHFGITTVEAMSAGCVPIVYKAGGQPEVVQENKSGFLWSSLDELLEKTQRLYTDKKLQAKMSKEAQKRSKDFSVTTFTNAFDSLLADITR